MHLLVSFVSKIVLFIKPPLLKNQLNKKIKVMKNNKYGEHEASFDEFCFHNNIIHQTTTLPQ
jgi:hypothetical protein